MYCSVIKIMMATGRLKSSVWASSFKIRPGSRISAKDVLARAAGSALHQRIDMAEHDQAVASRVVRTRPKLVSLPEATRGAEALRSVAERPPRLPAGGGL